MATETGLRRWRAAAERPADGASLALFRIAFGVLMCASALRFLAYGWVDQFYVLPTFHFTWIDGLAPLPGWGMHGVFWALAALAALIAVGLYTRLAAGAFFILFTYVQILEKSAYLNHYYLIVWVSALMMWLPTERAFSLDARWRGKGGSVPAVAIWAVRGQLGLVYFFAGLAKVQPDWLFEAQPLKIWLAGQGDFPVLGPLLIMPEAAHLFSWAGMIFDLTIPLWFLWRPARPFAYATVLGFHLMTAALFQIGLFPWMMMCFTPIFFDPSWPRRLWAQRPWARRSQIPKGGAAQTPAPQAGARLRPASLIFLAAVALVQIALPLRHHLYPGNHLWTEEGFRFSWHVMVMEKSGIAELRVKTPTGESLVDLRAHLTPVQIRMMSTQPDMILDFAHALARDLPPEASIYIDSHVSLNGRRGRPLVSSEVDLRQIDSVSALRPWLLPLD